MKKCKRFFNFNQILACKGYTHSCSYNLCIKSYLKEIEYQKICIDKKVQ